jgi:hypothetical protein
MIKELIKQLFCKHEYYFARNIYGDEINYCGGYRSLWRCKKCNKLQWRESLYKEENINCQTFH